MTQKQMPPRSAAGMPVLVETHDVGKRYRAVHAARDITLRVAAGEVYGLVGPNGAGKTTLLRMLTGLIRPTAGTVRVGAGHPAPIGGLIESPAFYPSMSGRANLTLLARYWGIAPAGADAVLARVGLTASDARRRYRQYSLGMKQRLGIAAALLGDPRVVVLDEPTNGLDPGSIAAVRDIIRALRAEGRAVVLSSHLLAEVEQVADRVGILDGGRLIAEGTVDELRSTLHDARRVEVTVDDVDRALAVARTHGLDVTKAGDRTVAVTVSEDAPAHEVNRMLVSAGVAVSALSEPEPDLEAAFFGLLAAPDAAPALAPDTEQGSRS